MTTECVSVSPADTDCVKKLGHHGIHVDRVGFKWEAPVDVPDPAKPDDDWQTQKDRAETAAITSWRALYPRAAWEDMELRDQVYWLDTVGSATLAAMIHLGPRAEGGE